MSQVGSADVAIFPTFKGFRSTVVNEVDTTASTSGSKFSSTFSKAVKGVGAGIAIGLGAALAGAAAIASKGLDRALNIQDAKAQLKGLGNSAEDVATIMGSALDSVRGTAFGLDSAATIAASAVAAGIKPGEALTRTLKLTADAATIGKSSLSEMGDMVNKVATNGKLTTEVLQQFQGRGIPLLQMVADEYGITAEAAAEMVSRGEVDFATFQTALEKGVGGAALSSGATARGAFANIGASFGRLGAMFTGSAVDGAPALFVAIAGAVDRLAESLTPLSEQFSGQVSPALATLTEWIEGIDFSQVGATISAVFSTIRGAVKGVVEAFQTGDFSELGSTFGKIGSIVQPLFPLFVSLAQGVGGIAGSIGDVIAAGLPLLVPILEGFTKALEFLGDHPAVLGAALITLAGAFAIQRTAATAALALVPLQIAADIARTAALVANTNAARGNSTATIANAAATRTGFLTRLPATASILAAVPAFIAATAATVANRVAMVAGAVATGVATAAQWAMNAAMSANPIALVVIAIAALVAGLIYFFTQTELGKEIWANFTQFLSEAWANISAVFTSVWNGMLEVFTNVWNGIVTVFQFVWNLIVLYVTTYINTVLTIVTTIVTAISAVWSALWNGISSFFSFIWSGIVSSVRAYIHTVLAIVTTVVKAVSAVWGRIWTGISSFFSGIWDKIIGVVTTVQKTFSRVFGAIKGIITGAFEGAVGAAKNAINGIINAVNAAISGINGVIGTVGAAFGIDVSIPKIPHLAEGATVLPRSGGTLAILAEAGRAESVVDTGKINALIDSILDDQRNLVAATSASERDVVLQPTELSDSSIERLARAMSGYLRVQTRQGG